MTASVIGGFGYFCGPCGGAAGTADTLAYGLREQGFRDFIARARAYRVTSEDADRRIESSGPLAERILDGLADITWGQKPPVEMMSTPVTRPRE
jgi:hypothetical protein